MVVTPRADYYSVARPLSTLRAEGEMTFSDVVSPGAQRYARLGYNPLALAQNYEVESFYSRDWIEEQACDTTKLKIFGGIRIQMELFDHAGFN
ncbi:hypothetical protein AYI70_g9022 [Smittium culicis]|uniref:Uncharacterized protein n=1 Tax=Smittium culicis TaxID=133412 RepID=A0A1R1XDA7_9FUNG|nr:hypothetical protein AYI70_g9022 [Smittium culicis]